MSQPLKNPPPTAEDNAAAVAYVTDGIHAACPAYKPEGGPFDPLPLPETVTQCFAYEGCTKEALLADFVMLLSYFGIASSTATAENNTMLNGCFGGVSHHIPENNVVYKWETGKPLPPKSAVIPPPLYATFSQAEIERRAELDPPQKYNGDLAYVAADAHIWEPLVAESLIVMADNVEWSTYLSDETRYLLAKNMAGKGLPYDIGKVNPVSTYVSAAGGQLTAAEVLRIADGATLPGVPATP